ncbi:MAG: alpha/beta fold hydrolase, partial [Polyangiaceae bacterium]
FESDFRSLIKRLCDEHAPAMTGAYALFGHSMGALLAHGLAQEQRARRATLPRALFAAGSGAPSTFDAQRFAKHDDAALIADLHKQGGTPAVVFQNAELLRIALDSLGSDYRLCDSFAYAPSQRLPCALHVLGGKDDELAIERLEAWQREAVGVFSLDWFDGGHFFIRQREEQVLALIAQKLSARVDAVEHDPVST